ncbi:MAG: TlyA family RNA methyltransferase [Desulfobacterales bacterium]|nr:TlyA family RNA methyltransferase [Desulfobacterales bacterium]
MIPSLNPTKKRLDLMLVERGIANTRQRAKSLIMAGKVLVNQARVDKPGIVISSVDDIVLKGEDIPYVSRGGLKLAYAIDTFHVDVYNRICMDVGASTGGFTDCLLQNHAKKVYAIDVGYGQLAWKIRQDPRVITIERTNIRFMTTDQIPERIDIVTIDVSFISLKLVVPVVLQFCNPLSYILALIKPQFEVGKGMVGKKGIVKDPDLHHQVNEELSNFFLNLGLTPHGIVSSPILGAKGNQEFIIVLQKR